MSPIQKVGTETIGKVRTTHYRMNVDLEKAFKSVPEDRRRAFDVVREVTGMGRLVHPGEIWLDAKGLPRRIVIKLKEERSRRDSVELTYRLDLGDFGTSSAVALPRKHDVSDVNDVSSLRSTSTLRVTCVTSYDRTIRRK